MRLKGWNDIPIGYGATFEVRRAPLWLRTLHRTPFLDRFSYPLLVNRGLGRLHPHPGASPELTPPTGWVVSEAPPEERELR